MLNKWFIVIIRQHNFNIIKYVVVLNNTKRDEMLRNYNIKYDYKYSILYTRVKTFRFLIYGYVLSQ